MDEVRKTKTAYASIVEEYFDTWSKVDFMVQALEMFTSYLKKGATVLDAGCGTDRDSKYLESKGLIVCGIDISFPMIRKAKQCHVDGKFVAMDFQTPAFKDESFDGIWACGSVIHVPKRCLHGVLLNFIRVVKEGGIIYISLKEGSGERYLDDGRFVAYYHEPEILELLAPLPLHLIGLNKSQAQRCAPNRILPDTWINLWLRKDSG